MEFLRLLLDAKKLDTNFGPVLASPIQLSSRKCDPYICSATRLGLDKKAIGGQLQPLLIPQPKDSKRWKRSLTVPISYRYSWTVSAWEDDKQEGSLLIEGRSSGMASNAIKMPKIRWRGRRNHPESKLVHRLSLQQNVPVVARRSLIKASGEEKTWSCDTASWLGHYDEAVLNNGLRSSQPIQKTLIELKREPRSNLFAIERGDTKMGKFTLRFVPKKRFSTSLAIKDQAWKTFSKTLSPSSKSNQKSSSRRNCKRRRRSSHVDMNVALDYRWKGDIWTVTNTLKGSRTILSLVTRSNPFRFTPRVQFPLNFARINSPWVSWTHAPGSSFGEIEIGREGLSVSAEFLHPKVSLRQKSRNGGSTQLSLDSKSMFSLDKAIIFEPMRNGSVLTLGTHVGNDKNGSSLTATLAGDYGLISISAHTSRSLNFTADVNLDCGNRFYSANVKLQNLKNLEARFGFFL